MTLNTPDIFSKNRSEESNEDNWEEFVVPPFINNLGIKNQSKAIVIVGGRGCGKTTLLRYFCHATQFSNKRTEIPNDALSHIGLYWRADTNFLNSFIGGDQSAQVWRSAFEHVLACELGKEIIYAIRNLNCNKDRQSTYGRLDEINLREVSDFDPSLGNTLDELEVALIKRRTAISMWLNNLDSTPKPIFLPADLFLKTLIKSLQAHLPYLAQSTFAVFIDEYENLREEQQSFINGLLKHGSRPLLYNIAMKRNGWQTKQTIGRESIQPIADYTEVDIENEISENFDLFAAELLFFRLAEHQPGLLCTLPIVPNILRSIEHLDQRYKNDSYRSQVISAAEELLPRVNERSAAKEILADSKFREKLTAKIQDALDRRTSKISAKSFIDDSYPEASLLMPALLSRPRETPENLLIEFEQMKVNGEGRLSPTSTLINNNLFGCVNAIYLDLGRPSILFSGFTSLTMIARGNIRYLLELIRKILKSISNDIEPINELPTISPNIQVIAVKEASEAILKTINGFGTHGPQLHTMVQCLGSIFKDRHRSDKQSEPETNHFTISSGDVNERLRTYFLEAEKWSVLFLTSETKMKSTGSISFDYVLNPIFSPYFQISFRKKRSLQFSAHQLLIMLEGDQRARDLLVRDMGRQINPDLTNQNLFDET